MPALTKSSGAASVDEYLGALPEKERVTLEKLRNTIKSVVPDAEEGISYQIPTFKYHGGLVGFAAFKDHCSFFTMNSTLVKEWREELKEFKTATGTIQFTVEKPIADSLVRKIVKTRMKENEALLLARHQKKVSGKERGKD